MQVSSLGGIATILIAALLFSCAKQESAKNGESPRSAPLVSVPEQTVTKDGMLIKPLRVIAIDSVDVSSQQAVFKVTVQAPDLCWQFSHSDVQKSSGKWLITVYGKRNPEDVCAQMIGTFDAEVAVQVNESGEYQCHFWCGEGETLNQAVSVPK